MYGWRGRSGLWPGRGPFSYLPPWERPGWILGREACWRYGYPPALFPYKPSPTSKEELEALEAYKGELEEELKGVEARIKELRETKG